MLGVKCWVMKITYRGDKLIVHSHHDTSSEGGVTSVFTSLSIRRGAGGEASVGCKVL